MYSQRNIAINMKG
ncbi:hypothetical protein, partial [Plasmodium yoelii yoelii]